MLDLRRLVVLREFAVQGTVARAAKALAFTPSAVSQQLAQLQREAGVALFRRAGRRLELTDAGRMLVDRAGDLLARVEEVQAELAAHSGSPRGIVRVAAFQTAALELVTPALRELATAHPALEVELVEAEAEDSLPALERGAVDVAIAEEYEHAPRPHVRALRREHLRPDEMLLVLPRREGGPAPGAPVSLTSLRESSWVTARPGTAFADMFTRLCRTVGGFEPRVGHRAGDMRLLLELVATQGVAALLPALGRPDRDGRVAVHRIAEGSFARAIFLATRTSDHARPATAAVVAAICSGSAAVVVPHDQRGAAAVDSGQAHVSSGS